MASYHVLIVKIGIEKRLLEFKEKALLYSYKDTVHYNAKLNNTGNRAADIDVRECSDEPGHVHGKRYTTLGGPSEDDESFIILENKIENLSDLLQEQQNVLMDLKKDLKDFTYNSIWLMKELNFSDKTQQPIPKESSEYSLNNDHEKKDRVKYLQDDLDLNRNKILESSRSLELEIKDALIKFFQSDDLKEQIVASTEKGLKDIVRSNVSQVFTAAYLPIMEQSHRRLLIQVTKVLEQSFTKLGKKLGFVFTAMHRKMNTFRIHESMLEEVDLSGKVIKHLLCSLKEILLKELKEWRVNISSQIFKEQYEDSSLDDDSVSVDSNYMPPSPPQPLDPKSSVIDQLLKSAEINKQIKEGNVNGSFEKALSSSDLALVMAACRAADPLTVFASPCKLQQSVLLSLIQQLATDMVHETQLKCRYIEDAIINVNTCDAITRSHLPLVVKNVRDHMTNFLISYPKHVASRRIRLIIMAADNLLK